MKNYLQNYRVVIIFGSLIPPCVRIYQTAQYPVPVRSYNAIGKDG